MSTALTLVVLIASSDASDPTVGAMTRAAREALGPTSQVVVRELPRDLSDEDAVTLEHALHADAIVEVTWQGTAHLRARMHLHSDKRARWIDREISFDTSDVDAERGRAIGFTVASMIPERPGAPLADESLSSTPAPAPTPAPKPPVPVAKVASTGRARDERDKHGKQDESEERAEREEHEERVETLREESPRAWVVAVDVAASGGIGVAGDATGIGVAFAGQWYFGPRFALRLGGVVRAGDVPEAQATSTEIAFGPGVLWRASARAPTLAHPFGFAVRADLLAVRLALARTGDASHPSRWIPAADLMLDATWLFTARTGFFAAIGPEIAFGATDVVVHGVRVATVPPLRGIAEIGLRVRF